MPTIDGLVTGIDTASVIDGLLQVQQTQIDRFNLRRSAVVEEQTAFSGIETRLLGLQNEISRLANIQATPITDKFATSSDEAILTAASSDRARVGTYSLSVTSMATAHQMASSGFASPDSVIATGNIKLRVGDGQLVNVEVDSSNNSLDGLAAAINSVDAGMSATVIDDGTAGSESYRLLLSANQTGARNTISFEHEVADGNAQVSFDPLLPAQEAADAVLQLGSSAGAISVQSATNEFDEVIPGVTLSLHNISGDGPVTLTIENDVTTAKQAITEFVDSFNSLMEYVDAQSAFNSTTQEANPLLGNRTAVAVQDEVRLALTGVIGGNAGMNRLNSLGISFNSNGHLSINAARLDDALAEQLPGVSVDDVARLFALSGESNNAGLTFVSGSINTAAQNVQVDITSAAQRASITSSTDLAAFIDVTDLNNVVNLTVDGQTTSDLSLTIGTYTQQELAAELQAVINSDDELFGRKVTVSVTNNRLRIRSDAYGVSSEVRRVEGTARDILGFDGTEGDIGQDVVGRFIVGATTSEAGTTEAAIGTGQFLRGEAENDSTADLHIRVGLTDSQLQDGPEGTLYVVRGFAARLGETINRLMRTDGRIATANDQYDSQLADIANSIEHLNERFAASQESLIRQFAALETAVNDFNSTSSFLASQLGAASELSGLG